MHHVNSGQTVRQKSRATSRYNCGTFLLMALSIAGACLSGLLLSEHDGGWGHGTTSASTIFGLCNSDASPQADCAEVLESRWGSFDVHLRGRRVLLPTSFFGTAYFLTLSIWFGVLGRAAMTELRHIRFTLALLTLGIVASIFLSAQMAFSLQAWCPACLIIHAINVVMIAAYFGLTCLRSRAMAHHEPCDVSLARIALVGAGAGVAGSWMYFDAVTEARRQWRLHAGAKHVLESLQADAGRMVREWHAEPRAFDVGDDESEWTSIHSLPRLLMFADPDCSACACFERQWHDQFAAAFGHAETRHIRLLPGENDHAARIAHAARLQGGDDAYRAMYRLLLTQRRTEPARTAEQYALSLGLDPARLATDAESETVREAVARDVALAGRLGVLGTPTIYVDGRRVPELCLTSPTFWQAAREELNANAALAQAP